MSSLISFPKGLRGGEGRADTVVFGMLNTQSAGRRSRAPSDTVWIVLAGFGVGEVGDLVKEIFP